MALRLLALGARSIKVPRVPLGAAGAHHDSALDQIKNIIGNREVVTYGVNGHPIYLDRVDYPFPAIRWKETTPEIKALREKEKGDWRQLTTEEKKQLYRASYRQTYAEYTHPTGEWKSILGIGIFLSTFAIWIIMFMKLYVYDPLPASFAEDKQKAQLRRMLDLHVNPVEGISSKWDYEKNTWKK